ncbi:MAG: hypothetical protein LLF94_07185 [Chlamydiales bacterium]|nr:hypothetical protein [Chlamydiales bacterium]
MPTYCYRCQSCNKEQEIVQKMSDEPIKECPFCHQEAFKRVPPKQVSIQFKGSGFYITDYTKKNTPDGGGCGNGSCGNKGCH